MYKNKLILRNKEKECDHYGIGWATINGVDYEKCIFCGAIIKVQY